METPNADVRAWVEECAKLLRPDRVVWCDGSEEERRRLLTECLLNRELIPLDGARHPGSTLLRSAPEDPRTEKRSFLSVPNRDDAASSNAWMSPEDAKRKLTAASDGAMKGRTMYAAPFVLGPPGSALRKFGVEVTDSRVAVLLLRIMARMGTGAWEKPAARDGNFLRGILTTGDGREDRRLLACFPEENLFWSAGLDGGESAFAARKAFTLRIASGLGRREGWLAARMAVLGVETPHGGVRYLAAAFPPGCGKTALAMLSSPAALPGNKVWTVADGAAWLKPGPDGRLWAVNPEAGLSGAAAGVGSARNPRAAGAIAADTIFAGAALRPDGSVWWEGHDDPPPAEALDWEGRPWTPASGGRAAHPDARFIAPLGRLASLSPRWEDPQGVPLDAILFGARRARLEPLVYETFDWSHGVFAAACAARDGGGGTVRRDPMGMLHSCGIPMADYFALWLSVGRKLSRPPRIFRVNWFRKGPDGAYLWPGFAENLRVLLWILERCQGEAPSQTTPLGEIPPPAGLPLRGLDLGRETVRALLSVDGDEWRRELASLREYFAELGNRLPAAFGREMEALAARIGP
jgi:phosphoenolpyruvate carboxykinase (GTP)